MPPAKRDRGSGSNNAFRDPITQPYTVRALRTGSTPERTPGAYSADVASEEVADAVGDEVELLLEREMARVEQVQLGVGQVALVGLGAGGAEDLVVLAPGDQRRR